MKRTVYIWSTEKVKALRKQAEAYGVTVEAVYKNSSVPCEREWEVTLTGDPVITAGLAR